MKKIIVLFLTIAGIGLCGFSTPDANEILKKIDDNLSSDNQIMEAKMIIHGRRTSRTITSRIYAVGNQKSFTEYLSPPREQGTKMLKLENQLWVYSPSTDRVIQISGHMLRQSVMGSDLSYEDMMEDRKLTDTYNAQLIGLDTLDGREIYLIELEAKVPDVAYHGQKIWVDTERFVPLKQELYARGGRLLKQVLLHDVIRVDGRWFPTKMIYKDMLKEGDGTEFHIIDIQFDVDIPEYIFTRAALRR